MWKHEFQHKLHAHVERNVCWFQQKQQSEMCEIYIQLKRWWPEWPELQRPEHWHGSRISTSMNMFVYIISLRPYKLHGTVDASEIPPVEVGRWSHCLQGFIHPKRCKWDGAESLKHGINYQPQLVCQIYSNSSTHVTHPIRFPWLKTPSPGRKTVSFGKRKPMPSWILWSRRLSTQTTSFSFWEGYFLMAM